MVVANGIRLMTHRPVFELWPYLRHNKVSQKWVQSSGLSHESNSNDQYIGHFRKLVKRAFTAAKEWSDVI